MKSEFREEREWSMIITEAYANETKPSLTDGLKQNLHAAVCDVCVMADNSKAVSNRDIEAINRVLDHFEADLDAVSGPRLLAVNPDSGAVKMGHRSEAGHPLRAFGGQ